MEIQFSCIGRHSPDYNRNLFVLYVEARQDEEQRQEIIFNTGAQTMLKIDVMAILNSVLNTIAFIDSIILAGFALYVVERSQASPIPALICLFISFVVDSIISHILIKNKREDSLYFTPEHKWKYNFPIDVGIFLIIIGIYLFYM